MMNKRPQLFNTEKSFGYEASIGKVFKEELLHIKTKNLSMKDD